MLPLRPVNKSLKRGTLGMPDLGFRPRDIRLFFARWPSRDREFPSFAVHDVCDNWPIDLLGLSEAAPADRLATTAIAVQIRQNLSSPRVL